MEKENNKYIVEMLTFKDACLFLGVSESYLYKLTSLKRISYSKPGGKLIYFRKQDLVDWMNRNKIMSYSAIESHVLDYCKKNKKV